MKKTLLLITFISSLVIGKTALCQTIISPDTRMIFVFQIPLGKQITKETLYQGLKTSFASVITEDYRTTFEMLELGGEEGNPAAKYWVYNEPLAYAMGTATVMGVLGFFDKYVNTPDKEVSKLRKLTSYIFLGSMIYIEVDVIHGNIEYINKFKNSSDYCNNPAIKDFWRIIKNIN